MATIASGAARAEVRASGDANIAVITSDVGRFFIARRCISSVGGDPNGAGASIGPGYIYRMDIDNNEVLAPEPAGEPQTGLGLFQLDVYREQDKGDCYGGFRALQGNICRGDPNGIFFSEGAGVVPQDDFRDDAGGGPVSQTSIWLHYTVDLADPHGVVLVRLQCPGLYSRFGPAGERYSGSEWTWLDRKRRSRLFATRSNSRVPKALNPSSIS